MKSFNKLMHLFVFLFVSVFAEGQTVKVKKDVARVKGENTPGFEVALEGTAAEVNASFVKFLKTVGKVKQASDVNTINEPTVNGATYALPLFALTKDNGKTSSAWIGLKAADWPKENADKVNKELEKLIRDFGIKFYRDKIQVQIDESTRASQAVEKQKLRLINENKSLNTKLESNKREKVQLEKSLVNNKLELEALLKKIEKNKKSQDSVAIAGEQIKKVTEMHKEKQKKVN